MDKNTNFLIGRAERLMAPIKVKRGFGESKPVYSLAESRRRLKGQIRELSGAVAELGDELCPSNIAVAKVSMNPSYLARSYYPGKLLRRLDMVSVGSRTTSLVPEKWKRKENPFLVETTQIFVAGRKSSFATFEEHVIALEEETSEALEFARIERIDPFELGEKVIGASGGRNEKEYYEVCLHLMGDLDSSSLIIEAFERYAARLGVEVRDDYQFEAGNLWFVPVLANVNMVTRLSLFTMVRLIRPMPKLRGIRPVVRGPSVSVNCQLPDAGPVSNEIRVALLDGGLPNDHPVDRWLDSYIKLNPLARDDPDGTTHGLGVTSAFLFGPLKPGSDPDRPYAPVTKIRVLDEDTENDRSLELYQTLAHIEEILESGRFEYLNLSLGPDVAIDDDDVHAWTSVIDSHLADGRTFMTVAAGNNGELDKLSGNARIQVPSDCINATAVGASDTNGEQWARATYSAMGPGRRPGVIKPDMVAFGGSASEYFHVLTEGGVPRLMPSMGTSFASPYLLRQAVGIRATLGKEISPLVAKALLVHSCESSELAGHQEIGWGRMPEDIEDIITSPDGVARIVYQGELAPSKYVKAPIPMPPYQLKGKVKIKATFCYACETDPQDSASYSKAGLEVTFRPHTLKTHKSEDGMRDIVDTRSFFSKIDYLSEAERRKYSQKWETTLHGMTTMLGRSLHEPNFEVHYVARDGGGEPRNPRNIRYALIITIESKHHMDLYSDILKNYAQILSPIRPRIEVPIQV